MLVSFSARGPLRHHWFAVARSGDIDETPLAVEVLREQLVLWRGPSGTVIAAPNKCTHRAGQLHLGKVQGGRLACPSHGWTFGEGGRCVNIPMRDVIPDDAHLSTYSCDERYGLVWLCFGAPRPDLPTVPVDEDPSYSRAHASLGTMRAPAPRIIETLLDHDGDGADFDIPFTYRQTVTAGDGIAHVRLISCAPIDATTTAVSVVVWSNDPNAPAEAIVAAQVTAGAALKDSVEAVSGMYDLSDPTDGEDATTAAAWRDALRVAVSATV